MNLSWFCIFICRSVRGFAVQLLMNLPIVTLHRVLMSCQYSFHTWLFANPVITSKGLDHPGATQQQLHSTFALLSLDPAASLESELEQTRRSSCSHKIAYNPKSVTRPTSRYYSRYTYPGCRLQPHHQQLSTALRLFPPLLQP